MDDLTSHLPPASANRLVAVVVTYNRLEKLKGALAALLAAPAKELAAVVVVNNASDDGTSDWLAAQTDARLDVVNMQSNSGGAQGFEDGMRHAMAAHVPDWLLLFDDDAYPAPDALAQFHTADKQDWDALAAAVYLPDGTICPMNRPSCNPFGNKGLFLRTFLGGGRGAFHMGTQDYTGAPQQVDISSFVGFFVRATIVERIGYPDGAMFIYTDDSLYTLGLTQAGGRLGFMPMIRFVHDCSTFDPTTQALTPIWKVYYYHRNLTFLYKRAAGWLFVPLMVFVLPLWLLKGRRYAGQRGLFYRLLASAIGDGLRNRTGTDHAALLARVKRG